MTFITSPSQIQELRAYKHYFLQNLRSAKQITKSAPSAIVQCGSFYHVVGTKQIEIPDMCA